MIEMKKKNDSRSNRGIAEITQDNMKYRIVSLLSERYRIQSLLSVGGFGVIYIGEDNRLYNKKILIKANKYPRNLFKVQRNKALAAQVLKIRDRLQFERKMLIQGANRGISGIPVILDEVNDIGLDLYGPHLDQDGNSYYCTQKDHQEREIWSEESFIILSYISGHPLNEIIDKPWFRKNILGNAKQLILQIGRILRRFHDDEVVDGNQLSFIYQDIKPDNIMFTHEKNFVLIDFGGFAVRANGKTLTRFSKTGTPGYQPPEFTDFSFPPENIDQRADVFSLGATVYHLITGSPPAVDSKECSVFDSNKMNTIPEDWRKWIDSAIKTKIENRFFNMNEALNAAYQLSLQR